MVLREGTPEVVASDEVARFDAIYSLSATAVLGYLLWRLPDADARDVAAETFVVVWRRLDEVPQVPLPWVMGVARNQMRNVLRSTRMRRALSERVRATMTGSGSGDPSGDVVEEPSRVSEALGALSEADREVLLRGLGSP